MFQAGPSAGPRLRLLVALRASVEEALGKRSAEGNADASAAPRAAAAAAGAGGNTTAVHVHPTSSAADANPRFAVDGRDTPGLEVSAAPPGCNAGAESPPRNQ